MCFPNRLHYQDDQRLSVPWVDRKAFVTWNRTRQFGRVDKIVSVASKYLNLIQHTLSSYYHTHKSLLQTRPLAPHRKKITTRISSLKKEKNSKSTCQNIPPPVRRSDVTTMSGQPVEIGIAFFAPSSCPLQKPTWPKNSVLLFPLMCLDPARSENHKIILILKGRQVQREK